MDEIEDYEQLAELESLLYSQIHYSVDTEPTPEMPTEPTKSNKNAYAPPRYFGRQLPASPSHEKTTVTNQSNPPQASPIKSATTVSTVSNNTVDEVPALHIHQPIQFKMPQFYQPPVNNIVFMAPNVPMHLQCNAAHVNNMSKSQRKKFNKQLKKSHEMTVQQAIHDAEVFRYLNNDDRARVLKMQKRQRYMARRKEKQKLLKEQQLITKFNDEVVNTIPLSPDNKTEVAANSKIKSQSAIAPIVSAEVIELSESDEDEIIALDQSFDTVVVSSDEECSPTIAKIEKKPTPTSSIVNEDDDGSVQFVEIPVAEPIVLDVEAGPSKTDAEMMKPPSDPSETASFTSSSTSAQSNDKNAPVTPRKSLRLTQSRYKDLLSTPESSNDFLDTTLDVSQQNFNFSLHGNDLCAEKSFLKPRSLAETYESESSCSTSDISSLKNPVFNELEFDSPGKLLFAEADLGSFCEYITPKRKVGIPSLLTPSADDEGQPQPGPSKTANLMNSSDSDSSSESELEDEHVSAKPKRKRLPSLSHFEIEDTPAQSTPITKKTKNKKGAKALNKFDFIKDAVEEEAKLDQVIETAKPKVQENKEKKGKKRKQKVSENTEDKSEEAPAKLNDVQTEDKVNDEAIDPKLGSGKKRKRQKSKSDTEIEKTASTPQKGSKKKPSTKSDSEVDDTNNDNAKKSKKKALSKSDSAPSVACNKNKEAPEKIIDATPAKVVNESPTKRRKRKSRSESNVEDSPTGLNASSKDKRKKEETITKEVIHEEEVPRIDDLVGLNDTSALDVVIIEVPPVCIDISSGDDDDDHKDDMQDDQMMQNSTDEEMPFDREELEKLKTNLELPNVKIVALNAWKIQAEPDHSIIYDTNKVQENTVATSVTSEHLDDGPTTKDVQMEEQKSWWTPGFDLHRTWETMPDDPAKWKIMERDRIHIKVVDRGLRCKRCRELGHLAYNCDRQILRCWLCGETGHQEPRCPNTVCSNCGRSTRFFTTCCGRCKNLVNNRCNNCDTKGHLPSLCPDVWRRYHLTTDPAKMIVSELPSSRMLKSHKDRWCSGCARSGHFEESCSYYNRTHNRTSSSIHKYSDVYNLSKGQKQERKSDKLSIQTRRDHPEEEVGEREADEDAVQHHKILISHQMNRGAANMLETIKGKEFLKSLFKELRISYELEVDGDQNVLNLRGYPTDLFAVSKIIKMFLADPGMSVHQIKFNNTTWSELQPKLLELLAEIAEKYKVLPTSDTTSKSVSLNGHVFDLLLAERSLRSSVTAQVIIDSQIVQTFKLKPDTILNIRMHPYMKVLAEKYSIQWSISNKKIFKIKGSKDNLTKLKEAMGDFRNKNMSGTHKTLLIINKIINHADYKPYEMTADQIKTLYEKKNVSQLNGILYRDNKKFQKLKEVGEELAVQMFCDNKRNIARRALIRFFKKRRNLQVYLTLKKPQGVEPTAAEETSTLDLYSLGHPSEKNDLTCYFMDLTPAWVHHLLNTPEGNDFLNELNASIPLEVKKDELKLCLYCSDRQRDEAIKKIQFYFIILNFDFPKSSNEILGKLLKWMALAKLDYYKTTCRAIYESLSSEKESSTQYKQLHGLLFAKYEFLDGRKHIDTVMEYIHTYVHNNKKRVSITEHRRIKMAAMYLFCPVPMDIDYKTLISLAAAPIILRIPSNEYKNTLAAIKSNIEVGFEKLQKTSRDSGRMKLVELQVLDEYLRSKEYSINSIEIAKSFVFENGLNFERKPK